MAHLNMTDMTEVLTPEDPEGYPIPGDVVVYTINITNQGSLTLRDVTPDSPQVGPRRSQRPLQKIESPKKAVGLGQRAQWIPFRTEHFVERVAVYVHFRKMMSSRPRCQCFYRICSGMAYGDRNGLRCDALLEKLSKPWLACPSAVVARYWGLKQWPRSASA